MRDQAWQVMLFAISISVVAFGIGFYVKKKHASPKSPLFARKSTREVASTEERPKERKEQLTNKHDESEETEHSKKPEQVHHESNHKTISSLLKEALSPSLKSEHAEERPSESEHVIETEPVVQKGVCQNIELPGDGFQRTQISREDWNKVIGQFNQAKKILKNWLTRIQSSLPEKTVSFMSAQLDAIKMVQPPTTDEPDLSWRGIGVWSKNDQEEPSIKLGSGFVKWVIKQPKRTLFEMTRLLAQTWAPCEMQSVDAGSMWDSFLSCLDVVEEQACGAGYTRKEGGRFLQALRIFWPLQVVSYLHL